MLGFLGTGHYLPKRIVTNADWEKLVDTSDEWIVSRTGIHERHFVDEDESNLTMSVISARMALERANVTPDELGLVVCATLTADKVTPGLSGELIRELNITCPAFDVNAACSGFIFATAIAQKMSAGKPVLIVATEQMSRIADMTDRSTCVLFGDGSGAAVLGECEGSRGIIACDIMTYPDEKQVLSVPGINHKNAEGEWIPSFVHMNGAETYKFATRILAKSIQESLAACDLSVEDVKWFVPHQANIRIIETAAKLLNLPMDRFFVNIDHTSNTSCASSAIALDELVSQNAVQTGDIIVLSTFGGGLTTGILIMRW